jgi:SdrD B-like domain
VLHFELELKYTILTISYRTTILPPPNHTISNSTELGDGTGANPTTLTIALGETKSAGKDGLHPIPTSTITGSVYLDINDSGIQESYENDSLSSYNISTVRIISVSNNSLYYDALLNSDGSYSILVQPGLYSIDVLIEANIFGPRKSSSLETGDGTGSNNRQLNIGTNQTKSAGKIGMVIGDEAKCTVGGAVIMFLDILGSIKASAEELPTNCVTVAGSIYEDKNNNGTQNLNESNYSITNPFPAGTTAILRLVNDITTFFEMLINPDGTYSQTVPFGQYEVKVNAPTGYTVSNSTENGAGTGSNPTIVNTTRGLTTQAGKDGLFNGILTPAIITGKIYPDLNNNGFQDNNEPDYSAPSPSPVNTVRITNTASSAFFDTVINFDGTYSQVVPAGDYSIAVDAPALYTISNSTELGDGVGNNPSVVTISAGEIKNTGKDGLYKIPMGTITGKIYPDLNGTGIQDPDEPDYSATNPIPAYINFNANSIQLGYIGYYPFGTVQQDGTFVMELPPNDYEFYMGVGGGVSITQSDANNNVIKKRLSSVFTTVNDNQTIQLGKFGIYSEPDYLENIYSGYVYEDLNNNGIKEAGEKGIEGVKLIIDGEGSDGLFYYTDANGKYNIPYFVSENPLTVKQFQPSQYDDGIDSLGLYATSTTDDQIFFQFGYFGFSVNNNFGERPKTTQTQAGGGVIIVNQDNQKPIVKAVDQAKSSTQLPNSKVESKTSSAPPTLAIDRKFDLDDPYVCGGYIYGNVISNPSIIADLNIEFTQDGKVVKSYNFKTNPDGTWKQLLDDLPYGKYSYRVVAKYEELTDTESFKIEHKSLEQCQNKLNQSNTSVDKESKEIVLARTGGAAKQVNLSFMMFVVILVMALAMSIFRNSKYLRSSFFYSYYVLYPNPYQLLN